MMRWAEGGILKIRLQYLWQDELTFKKSMGLGSAEGVGRHSCLPRVSAKCEVTSIRPRVLVGYVFTVRIGGSTAKLVRSQSEINPAAPPYGSTFILYQAA